MRAILSALLLVAVASAGYFGVQAYLDAPLRIPPSGHRMEIASGTPWSAVARDLAAKGIVRWPAILILHARVTGDAARVKAGEYELSPGLTPRGLLDEVVNGRVLLHSVTLVEGRTVGETLKTLHAHPALRRTLASADARAIARELDLEYASAEGAFLPETYRFPRGTTDRELLLKAHAALREVLADAWQSRAPDLPLANPYELLILASIVERETGLARERPMIAGVFVRRLRLGMRLQTDPTVIYGLGDRFDGNLTRKHLDSDTPWNTYTRGGLPPTPIAAPSADALRASAHPAPGTSIFFVASGAGDGSHRFSDTLAEHQAAVRDYLVALRNSRSRPGGATE